MIKIFKTKLLLSLLFALFISAGAYAQSLNDPRFDAIKHANERTSWMQKALRLDSVQTKKVSSVNVEIYTRYKAEKDIYPIKSKQLNDALKNLEQERDARFEEILTQDQMDLYKMAKAHHDR